MLDKKQHYRKSNYILYQYNFITLMLKISYRSKYLSFVDLFLYIVNCFQIRLRGNTRQTDEILPLTDCHLVQSKDCGSGFRPRQSRLAHKVVTRPIDTSDDIGRNKRLMMVIPDDSGTPLRLDPGPDGTTHHFAKAVTRQRQQDRQAFGEFRRSK